MQWLTEKTARKIADLLNKANEGRLAVAFWGDGALEELELTRWRGEKPLQIICNLKSGATNPKVIKKMRELGMHVRMHDRLHAKVYWTDKGCVFGSANASANGLSYEGRELTGWLEANCLANDPQLLQEIKTWFSTIWEQSSKIDDKVLNEAQALWDKQRNNRPFMHQPIFNPDDLNPNDFRDREIVITTYLAKNPSRSAKNKFKQLKKAMKLIGEKYDFYEGESLKKGVIVLDCSYAKAGKPEPQLDDELWKVMLITKDGSPKITILEDIRGEGVLQLSNRQRKNLERMVRAWLDRDAKSEQAREKFDGEMKLSEFLDEFGKDFKAKIAA